MLSNIPFHIIFHYDAQVRSGSENTCKIPGKGTRIIRIADSNSSANFISCDAGAGSLLVQAFTPAPRAASVQAMSKSGCSKVISVGVITAFSQFLYLEVTGFLVDKDVLRRLWFALTSQSSFFHNEHPLQRGRQALPRDGGTY